MLEPNAVKAPDTPNPDPLKAPAHATQAALPLVWESVAVKPTVVPTHTGLDGEMVTVEIPVTIT